jgi:hypothetical protein
MLRSLAEHVPSARIDALDMVEEGDKVARRVKHHVEKLVDELGREPAARQV